MRQTTEAICSICANWRKSYLQCRDCCVATVIKKVHGIEEEMPYKVAVKFRATGVFRS